MKVDACLPVGGEGVDLQTGACHHDKVAVSGGSPEEPYDGLLPLYDPCMCTMAVGDIIAAIAVMNDGVWEIGFMTD